MKKFTNHTQGAKGITLTDGTTRWVEPGDSVEIDEKLISGKVPDMGKAGKSASADDDALDDLKAQVADLTKQVEDLTKERDGLAKDKTTLTKQVEDLTKPK